MVGFVLIQLYNHHYNTLRPRPGTKGGDLSGTKSFIPDPVAVVACTIVQMKFQKKAHLNTKICFAFKFSFEY